jgi:hypothetical protein
VRIKAVGSHAPRAAERSAPRRAAPGVAGRYFKLVFTLVDYPDVTVETPVFAIAPAAMKLAYGATPTDYAAGTFPYVVQLDGADNDSPNVHGLPTAIVVSLLGDASTVLSKASCSGCMIARLVKCDDSTPAGGTTSGEAAADWAPTCTSSFDAGEPDQMAGVTQARCATPNEAGTICTSYSTESDHFRYTISDTLGAAGGTTADVVAGVATFSGLQVRFVVGAGYRLRFVFNPIAPEDFDVVSAHAAARGNVFFPDAGAHVTATVSSFFVRPHSLAVLQSPGGDGVDLGGGGGDAAAGTPDGVGRGVVFRVQPIIALKGDGYYFTASWDAHGHVPVTAMIRGDACGGAYGDCTARGVVLSGTLTPPAAIHTTFTPVSVDDEPYAVTADGTAGGVSGWSGTPSGADAVVAAYAQTTSVAYGGTSYTYVSSTTRVGFVFKDLEVVTADADTSVEAVRLAFFVGVDTLSAAAGDTGSGGAYTLASSGAFDVFLPPEPPTQLRAEPYGARGIRIEWDPPPVTRARPLSGFIVELLECTQARPALFGSASRPPLLQSHF